MKVKLSDKNIYSVSVQTELYNAYISFYSLSEDGISFRVQENVGYDDVYEAQDILGCISYFQENPIEFNDEVVAI
jgi:hypothetical protein